MRRPQKSLDFGERARPTPIPVVRVPFYPIRYGTPEYFEYWTWHGRGTRDEPQPNETLIRDDDPAMAYARLLGWRHGRQARPRQK